MVSKTSLDGYVRELFVSGDRVVAYVASAEKHQSCTYGYDCELGGDGSSTDIVVLDVADRVHPRVVRTLELSGSLIAARRIGDTIHTVVSDHETSGQRYDDDPSGVPWCGVNAKRRAALRPKWDALVAENERKLRAYSIAYPTVTDGNVTTKLCDVLETPMADGKAFTTIVSFELQADAKPAATRTIRSRPGTVFASESGLYLAVRHDLRRTVGRYGFFDDEAEVSDIHKFRLGAKAEATQYVGSGVVAGHVLNQLSMDEWHGALRVATTRGRVPDPSVESAVSTFVESPHGNLLRVGAVLHLAPHEDIRAVRFDDDRGYVVTFKKTDPLFVLDLKSTTEPRVLGELKIPGFSTYLHRIDPTHLLSIGYDADDHGEFAYFGGLLLQLFDVEDPLNPRLLHRETIGSRGSSSEAAGNHLAFTFDRGRNLLAIPGDRVRRRWRRDSGRQAHVQRALGLRSNRRKGLPSPRWRRPRHQGGELRRLVVQPELAGQTQPLPGRSGVLDRRESHEGAEPETPRHRRREHRPEGLAVSNEGPLAETGYDG